MTAPVAERGRAWQLHRGIGRAAVMIGVITAGARAAGFTRQVVFAHTVRTSCLGTAYTTANTVPNIIYDIVIGGVLGAAVVPVLARPATGTSPADAEDTRQISSALLTWTVLLLAPVSGAVALAAHPLAALLLGDVHGCARGSIDGVASRMLLVFAPQILLYGLAVVLYGIMQSHRKFGAPALAPLVSSLVVIGTYAGFGFVGRGYVDRLGSLPPGPEYLLSVGTSAGVLALVLTAGVPFCRLGVRLRPTLRFPAGVGARVLRLAVAGVITLVAQDVAAVVVIVLANRFGGGGALVLYNFAWAVFVLPYAVLAVPIATSAFPELSERGRGFDATAAASTRAVLLASCLGAAALAGACLPVAHVFESRSSADASGLALALVSFAPGLVGYGLTANLSRILYAHGRSRAPALAIGGGWLLVVAVDLALVPFVRPAHVVAVLGFGTTVGLTMAGLALAVLVLRERGSAAMAGVFRGAAAALAGCAAGVAAGLAVSFAVRVSGFAPNVAMALLACTVVAGAFFAVVLAVDGSDLRAAGRWLRTRT